MGEAFIQRSDLSARFLAEYTRGYNDGYSAGQTAGYNSGYSAGNTDGYKTGYAAGYKDGQAAGGGTTGGGSSNTGTESFSFTKNGSKTFTKSGSYATYSFTAQGASEPSCSGTIYPGGSKIVYGSQYTSHTFKLTFYNCQVNGSGVCPVNGYITFFA